MMGTSFYSKQTVISFAAGLASSARVFTVEQVARHGVLSTRTQPQRRARECLSEVSEVFECIPWIHGKPFLWRFTEAEKRRRGINYKRVGASQHTTHWLAIGDLWAHLVTNGIRPTKWFTEGKAIGRFDVFTELYNEPYLIEIQLTPLSDKEWEKKWVRRIAWMETQPWKNKTWANQFSKMPPKMMLITPEPMKPLTPPEVLYAKTFEQVKRIVRPLR